ncbi:MAG: DUF4430 domain-containing protein [Coriobacteriia bacterium]|nr:DUF4430 domain-containing protein [Coriobacteriia bacterium]
MIMKNDGALHEERKPFAEARRKAVALALVVLILLVAVAPTLSACSGPFSCYDPQISPPVGMFVKVTVDCTAPVNARIPEALAITQTGILFDDVLLMPDGYSPLLALQQTGLVVSTAPGPFIYVNAIGGIPEGITSAYPTSGWMFYVNGEMPMEGCNTYMLQDGDELLWVYSLTFDF